MMNIPKTITGCLAAIVMASLGGDHEKSTSKAVKFLDLIKFYFCISLVTRKMSAYASAQASVFAPTEYPG